MIKWLLYLIPSFVLSALCYLTNPIVVLLADEYGELDGFWHYWQTWDDSLDSAYFMHNCVPGWLDYGYDEHYTTVVDTGIYTAMYNKKRYFSTPIAGAEWKIYLGWKTYPGNEAPQRCMMAYRVWMGVD